MSNKATHPPDTPLYPIREVSRLTGVNSVTLRAWERRYGLIRPQRTPKGHRLYAQDDISRIERILQWLNRGVPVSQVADLLDQPETVEAPAPDAGDWSSQRQQLLARSTWVRHTTHDRAKRQEEQGDCGTCSSV